MNKTILLLVAIFVAAVTSGCASQGGYYAAVQASNQAQIEIAKARAQADEARYRALADVANTGDPSARVAVAMALALGGGDAKPAAGAQAVAPVPMRSEALEWASILAPTLTNVGLGIVNAATVRHQASMTRDIAVSTNATFGQLGASIKSDVITTSTTTNSVGDYSGSQSGTSGQIGNRSDSTHSPTVVTQPTPVIVQPVSTLAP